MKDAHYRYGLLSLCTGFALVCGFLYVFFIAPQNVHLLPTYGAPDFGDSAQYNALAISLVRHGTYSFDGVTPFFEREPGYSIFVAAIYRVVGIDRYGAVFAVQVLLYLAAVAAFASTIRRAYSARAALLMVGFLFALPSVYHVMFSLLRESVALSLMLLFVSCSYRALMSRSTSMAIAAGCFLGFAALTYVPFLLLPPALIVLWIVLRAPWKQAAVIVLFSVLMIAPWGIRNEIHKGELCLTGCYRGALQWYVRGERSEQLRGWEPLRCLWSEYVSRDWTGRSPVCSFNATWHAEWPLGFKGVPADRSIEKAGQAKVLRYFPYYLWDSAFEILELHLPYVDGSGHLYNLLASAGMLLLYIGCAFGLPDLLTRRFLPFAFLIAYNTGVFMLTDATPRYLLPMIFCYALLAALGYDRILTRLFHACCQHRHSGL